MDRLERLFEPDGQVPWDELINPLWNELISYVEEAWMALYSSFILPDEERLPLTYKLIYRAESLFLFLAAISRFSFDCARYATLVYASSPRPWMHLSGWRFPLL